MLRNVTLGTLGGIRRELVERVPLVDEIVVIDSRSTDDTAAVAAAAGAEVVAQDAILPGLPPSSGKGEALWRSLAVTVVTWSSSSTPTCASSAPHS